MNLIDLSFPMPSAADLQAMKAMKYEAQQMFLALDDLSEAARFKESENAEQAYVRLAIAYDRFLKAGDLYSVCVGGWGVL